MVAASADTPVKNNKAFIRRAPSMTDNTRSGSSTMSSSVSMSISHARSVT